MLRFCGVSIGLCASVVYACGERAPPAAGDRQDLSGPLRVPQRRSSHPRLDPSLSALAAGEPIARPVERDPQGRVLVELELAADLRAQPLDEQQLARHGAVLRRRGIDHADVWVPPAALERLAASGIARLRLPLRPDATLGNVVTQGVALTGADAFHCRQMTGKGIHVAVVDLGFAGWTSAVAELGTVTSTPPASSNAHGTACAEILFDMAPGVVLHPVTIATLADVESLVAGLPQSGIKVVSSSLVWAGDSFGDGTGPHCKLIDQAKAAGVQWVTSAGNYGSGTHYGGAFTDSDGDGLHEFAPGDELNEFTLTVAKTVKIQLDWNAYPTTAEDYDLHLHQLVSGSWQVILSSTDVQSGSGAPLEVIVKNAAPGSYAISIERKKGTVAAMQLRLLLIPASIVLQHWQAAGSIGAPGHCQNAITVGAVVQSAWGSKQLWPGSSRGPTFDGRTKPDLVAPTEVATLSFGAPLTGTSAAAPHVAGALALLMEATGSSATAASSLLLGDADDAGTPVPNNSFGHGLLKLLPSRCGWVCKAGTTGPCTTPCGTTGQSSCGPTCTFGSCQPPAEQCNGKDDDCDGAADNGFACAQGSSGACTTSCGSAGTRSCSTSCAWGSCQTPAEQCNGKDDDCDGVVDNGFACTQGSVDPCTTSCGTAGQRSCAADCSWGECQPPAEQCNGKDDDCDGSVDNGFACAQGSEAECTTSCGSAGRQSCAADCTPGECRPPAEVCNARDDDCDGAPDNGLACVQGARSSCTTSCGSVGERTCAADCTQGECRAPLESCNGKDDDCDGQVDEACETPPTGCGCALDGAPPSAPLGLALLLLGARFLRRAASRRTRPKIS